MCGGGSRSMKTEQGGKKDWSHNTLIVVTYSGWNNSFPFKDIKSILQ